MGLSSIAENSSYDEDSVHTSAQFDEWTLPDDLTDKESDGVKQFKKSVFMPFWHNPKLNRESTAREHIQHAFYTLTGKHSDVLKKPFTENAFIGLILQLLKLNDLKSHGQSKETFYSIFEFFKLPLLKSKREVVEEKESVENDEDSIEKPGHKLEFIYDDDGHVVGEKWVKLEMPSAEDEQDGDAPQESPPAEEKKYEYVIDPNSCPVKDVILEGGDIKQLENRLGLIMNPLEAAALLCVEYSQHLRAKGKEKAQNAKLEHENTSPFLVFTTNIANRAAGYKKHNLEDVVAKFYRTVEAIFYFSVRLWVEIAAIITAPLWQLAQTIIAAVVLAVSFPIWYPIARGYYSKGEKYTEEMSNTSEPSTSSFSSA